MNGHPLSVRGFCALICSNDTDQRRDGLLRANCGRCDERLAKRSYARLNPSIQAPKARPSVSVTRAGGLRANLVS